MTDDPYRSAPPGPPPPPHFSPLRPIRAFGQWCGRFLWWCLTLSTVGWQYIECVDHRGLTVQSSEPTGFGCLGGIVAIVAFTTVAYLCGGISVPGWVYLWGGLVLIRAWLRAAMHLDEPASLAWWEARLR